MCLAVEKVPEVPFEVTAVHELMDLIWRELKHRGMQGEQTRRRPLRHPSELPIRGTDPGSGGRSGTVVEGFRKRSQSRTWSLGPQAVSA